MLSMQLSYTDDSKDRLVANGVDIHAIQEGEPLVSVIENNIEKVKPSEGVANELLVGFAYANWFIPNNLVMNETTVLPTTPALTTVQLYPNVVSGSVKITGTSTWALKTTSGDPSVAGQFKIDTTTGVLSVFGAADESIEITYRRNLSFSEAQTLFGTHLFNGQANEFFEQVTCWKGNGEIWTDCYDTSLDWSSATLAYTGANGKLTTATTGCLAGRIIGRPSSTNKFLGIVINLG
jgi:hypothetical protein